MKINRTITTLALTGILAVGSAGAAQAKHGADDPAGHRAGGSHARHLEPGDDHGGRRGRGADDARSSRHGADDKGAKHHRHHRHHRHGGDDGPNHS